MECNHKNKSSMECNHKNKSSMGNYNNYFKTQHQIKDGVIKTLRQRRYIQNSKSME